MLQNYTSPSHTKPILQFCRRTGCFSLERVGAEASVLCYHALRATLQGFNALKAAKSFCQADHFIMQWSGRLFAPTEQTKKNGENRCSKRCRMHKNAKVLEGILKRYPEIGDRPKGSTEPFASNPPPPLLGYACKTLPKCARKLKYKPAHQDFNSCCRTPDPRRGF